MTSALTSLRVSLIRPLAVRCVPSDHERSRSLGAFFMSGGDSMAKVAILIDGGYLLKRLPTVRPKIGHHDAKAVNLAIRQLVTSHLKRENKIACAANVNRCSIAFSITTPALMTARSTNPSANIVSTTQKPMKRNSGTTCSSNCDAHPTPPCGLAKCDANAAGC